MNFTEKMRNKVLHTRGNRKPQLMLPPWAQLGAVVAVENVGLEVGKVNDFVACAAHPPSRADLVGYKGCPDRLSGDVVSESNAAKRGKKHRTH